jgi:DNA-binding NarL/FixJ family response regulator
LQVLLVGFSPVTALGIETALSDSLRAKACIRVDSPSLAIELAELGNVNMIITDPYRPTFDDGLRLCRKIKALALAPLILAFSELHARRALAFFHIAGIDSFVAATEPPERLASTAVSTLNGKCEWVFDSSDGRRSSSFNTLCSLTSREQEVLWMVSNRCTNEQIGRSLSISPNTVKNHVAAILRKLGAKRRSELFSGAISLGRPA